MLSRDAFNALLKIMEEPPAHLLFILATTEIQKVPATILSRCQRFNFKRILPHDMEQQLLKVAKAEAIDLTPDGADLLAHHLGKGLGPVFAVQRLVHGHTSLLTNKINESSAVSHRAGTLAAHG